MMWENLIKGRCPYCNSKLKDEEIISCTFCSFKMERPRAVSMIDTILLKKTPGYVKKKWQNLHQKKCPVCNGNLIEDEEQANRLKCMNTETCVFNIDIFRMKGILEDENHSCNRFNNIQINPFTYEREFIKEKK